MSEAAALVSVIMVNYNTRDLLLRCIESVVQNSRDCAHEIVVVDNASADGSAQAVASRFPTIKLIANSDNSGFAAASNQGAAVSAGNLLLFLNPDTIVHPEAIRRMRDFVLSAESVGVVGCKLLNGDGTLQQSSWNDFPGIGWCWKSALYLNSPKLCEPEVDEGAVEVSHLLGACIMVRRELFQQLRGFDEKYFLYMEETDLCYRARKLGLRNYLLPSAAVVHLGQQSSLQAGDWTSSQLQFSTYAFIRDNHNLSPAGRALLLAGMQLGGMVRATLWAFRLATGRRDRRTAAAMMKGYLRLIPTTLRFEPLLRQNGGRAVRIA